MAIVKLKASNIRINEKYLRVVDLSNGWLLVYTN